MVADYFVDKYVVEQVYVVDDVPHCRPVAYLFVYFAAKISVSFVNDVGMDCFCVKAIANVYT